jgi:hypothetical protein
MNSELSLKEEINIYINSGLTPSELFILRLLFLAQDGDTSLINNYISNADNGKEVFKVVLKSLQNKGIILASFKMPKEGEILRYTDIPINKNFVKKFIRESNQIGKEFFDAYPPFIYINGKMASIKNITKAGLFSIDEFCFFYGRQLKLSSVKHERVMEALEYGKEHNLINYSILEFIASQKWNEIEYIRSSGEVAGYQNSELL